MDHSHIVGRPSPSFSTHDDAHDIALSRLLDVLRRRKRLVAAVAMAGTIAVSLMAWSFPTYYTAKAQIVVERPQIFPFDGRFPGPENGTDLAAVMTVVTTLTSNDLLERVLMRLENDPGDRTPAASAEAAHAVPALTWWRMARERWEGMATSAPIPPRLMAEAVEDLQRRLRVYQENGSQVIAIDVTSTTPAVAASVANNIAQYYLESGEQQRRARLDRLIDGLAAVMANPRPDPGLTSIAVMQFQERLRRRQAELIEQRADPAPAARLLSRAPLPFKPVSPAAWTLILPGAAISLILGCFVGLIRNRFDQRLRTQADVTRALGLPCLGIMPQPEDPMTELAIRPIMIGLGLTGPRLSIPKMILITSSVAGEGTTAFAESLAFHAGREGTRVLLLTCGGSDSGVARRGGSSVTAKNLLVLLTENRMMNSTRAGDVALPLTVRNDLAVLLPRLRDTYDIVIIDTPPVRTSVDARLLADLADRIVFVVRWNRTRWKDAFQALGLLRATPGLSESGWAGQIAAVISRANIRHGARSQYGAYR